MTTLSNFVVRCADLVEAEGRALKSNAAKVAVAMAAVIVGAVFALGGVALVIGSVYLALRDTAIGQAGAVLVCGILCLAATGGLLWTGLNLTRR